MGEKQRIEFTGVERRTVLDPDLTEFVQVGDEVYAVGEVIEALKGAKLENVNRRRRVEP